MAAPFETAPTNRPTIGILGASASAGFGVLVVGPGGDGPGAVGTRLSEIVLAIEEPPPVVVRDWSTASFFTRPLEIGPEAVRRCAEGAPDAILAIDFLFWFAYGAFDAKGDRIFEESQRDALFEFGLSLLDSIEVPILVGDLPDVRGANPRMLSRWQVPSVETLERLNARLRAWAEARPHVRIFPLAERTRIALEDRGPPTNAPGTGGPREDPIESGKDSASSEPPGAPLIQRDRLHPTFEGLVLMTDAAIRAMQDVPAFASLGDALDSDDPRPLAERLRARILGEEAIPATAP
ncbi:MAG: hypothetical protein ACO3SJ_03790 [Phycisphaerales bacterium]